MRTASPPRSTVAVTVQRATLRDLEAIVAMRDALRREEAALAADTVPDDDRGRLRATTRRQLVAPRQAFFVAHHRARTVGLLRCALPAAGASPRWGVLTTAYVAPGSRRRGVLRALVDAAARWARGRGIRELRLRAHAANDTANAAWNALGFRAAAIVRRRVEE